ncbi:MAG: ammonium transporter [Solirubrobacteraceae bacterium]
MHILATAEWLSYPNWLNPGDNAWQLTSATFVGLMSLPGLAVLYGGVMQKRWSVNSMMLTFTAFSLTLIVWVLFAFEMGFGHPIAHAGSGIFGAHGFLGTFLGEPASILGHIGEQHQAVIPSVSTGPVFHFPTSTLAYFQFVFAAITPILALGSVLGRVNFKAWLIYVPVWITAVYAVNAFLIWGGGYWAAHGALDFSGGYVIHLAAGVSGFVFAAVIGPRLQRDREVDAPNNLLMVATGAGLLWLGWNGFNGGDPYYASQDAASAVLNTNLATAVAMMVWIAWDYIFREKPSLIGTVNGMITGLVAITPSAGFVNGWGAIVVGAICSTLVWLAIRFLSRTRLMRSVDDTLGVIYTHGIAGLAGGLLVGFLADPAIVEYLGVRGTGGTPLPGLTSVFYGGSWTLFRWQLETAAWVIAYTAIATFIILKVIGLIVPLRVSDEELEIGDHAIHGHEVYPADIPTLGGPHQPGWIPVPAGASTMDAGAGAGAQTLGTATMMQGGGGAQAAGAT